MKDKKKIIICAIVVVIIAISVAVGIFIGKQSGEKNTSDESSTISTTSTTTEEDTTTVEEVSDTTTEIPTSEENESDVSTTSAEVVISNVDKNNFSKLLGHMLWHKYLDVVHPENGYTSQEFELLNFVDYNYKSDNAKPSSLRSIVLKILFI